MRILFIGDVMGRSGREALQKHLPQLKEDLQPDVVIVNGENAASGLGITEKICKQFYEWGADVITTGNHVWDQREIIPYIDRDKNLLRPINFTEGTPGQGVVKYTTENGQTILVINAIARLFMKDSDNPFQAVEEIIRRETMGQTVAAIFIDFHGEATSEKMAFTHYFDGRVSAVVGTHTHVPTADHQILSGGTAYMTDAGMTGDYDSVIGIVKELAIHKFIKDIPGEKWRPANGEATLCGVLVVTDSETGKARSIEPIRLGGALAEQVPAA